MRAGKSLKEEFSDFDSGLSEEMIQYCLADCRATWDVHQHITRALTKKGFSSQSAALEHGVSKIIAEQERNGFAFDFNRACSLHQGHEQRMRDIETELQEVFPPIVEERYSEKTGKKLKEKVTVFNPGSRQQVAERLEGKGVVWKERTETGKPKVDESTLAELKHVPEAALVLEYLTLSKRIGMLKNWIDAVQTDGRIRGRVNTCGAVTGRMTHSNPNMAQIPSESVYRQCFTVTEGNVLVGADASSLELRCLAHYMQDEEYIRELLEGDVHTATQNAAGLATRADAKRFTYALLYGAGDAKLGAILGGTTKDGKLARDSYLRNMPAFRKLVRTVESIASKGSVPGIDGRRVWIRSQHAALNTLLQSCGAIIMKQALVLANEMLEGIDAKFVANVHDEFQVETTPEMAETVGGILVQAIIEAGNVLDLRCPLDGEYKVGTTWADTH
jgi:DNA polymerase I-like protein with 3'-5' exonuclease and polymerase domains